MNPQKVQYAPVQNGICCFTGHRSIPSEHAIALYTVLDETIAALYDAGVRTFRAGGAMGFDTLAALRILRFKALVHPDVHLALLLPCKNQTERWPREAVRDYEFILARADSITYVSEYYTNFCMHQRDRALVDGSDFCVAYLTSNRGGTAYTVSCAIKQHVTLINLGEGFL